MKSIFRTSFYLRSNYLNKEGKASVMMRIHLNGERMTLGTTGVSVDPEMWDSTLGKVRGRTKEALATNAQLTSISTDLQMIFQRLEFSEELSLERIKSEYLGKREDMETVLSLFTKYNNDMSAQIGCGVTKQIIASLIFASVTLPSSLKKSMHALTSISLSLPLSSFTISTSILKP